MQYDIMIFDYAKKFYTTEEYPALAYQRQQWASVKPFASHRNEGSNNITTHQGLTQNFY